jgi:hypothetical protein
MAVFSVDISAELHVRRVFEGQSHLPDLPGMMDLP